MSSLFDMPVEQQSTSKIVRIISYENRKRGEQVLFNGAIYADNSANVHSPTLSSIYRLGTNKKALSDVDNAHLVELAGTAPASARLSLLVVYRFRSFSWFSRFRPVNDQKVEISSPKS
ncbi:MAG: hypothetical protein JWL85_95 [Candidatus Saccharibacteria bacterium]|nr:hypothetical protein [Candidatus Saccharibacteria bacterium]